MTETRGSDCPVAAIILAAGKSTRMRSKTPKMLHPVCGIPMTAHVIRACREAGVSRVVLIVGHEADKVKAGLGSDVEYALQTTQRGTGDAVRAAESFVTLLRGQVAPSDRPPLFPSRADWIKAIREWAESHATRATAADWSRESIYSGRIHSPNPFQAVPYEK